MTDFSPQRERKRGNENEKDNIETKCWLYRGGIQASSTCKYEGLQQFSYLTALSTSGGEMLGLQPQAEMMSLANKSNICRLN